MVRKRSLKKTSNKLLNPTEHKMISNLIKMHRPILKEMEKWKEQREKLETSLLDQIDAIGKVLQPYYNQSRSRWEETMQSITGQRRSSASAQYAHKRTSRSKSRAKKSKSR